MKKLAVFMMLMPFSACAPTTEWSRSDTTPAQVAADQKSCDDIAAHQALDESFASGPKYPPLTYTQFPQVSGIGDADRSASYGRRGPRQYELAEYCMQQRGYYLIPIKS